MQRQQTNTRPHVQTAVCFLKNISKAHNKIEEMAPPKATEDYYLILEIAQTDTLETITASWKRLILQRHPDKNLGKNTTEDFQLVRSYNFLILLLIILPS